MIRLSRQSLNIAIKPKEVLVAVVNKFIEERFKEKGFVFSDSQLKFSKKPKNRLIAEVGFRTMSYCLSSGKI